MLNYTYGVLYSLVEKACICAGLDPYVGFLHTDNYGRNLWFRSIEPFRILGDRTALLFFTGRRVKAEYFEPVPGGVALSAGRPGGVAGVVQRADGPCGALPGAVEAGRTRNVKRRDVIRFEAHAWRTVCWARRTCREWWRRGQLWDEANEAAVGPRRSRRNRGDRRSGDEPALLPTTTAAWTQPAGATQGDRC